MEDHYRRKANRAFLLGVIFLATECCLTLDPEHADLLPDWIRHLLVSFALILFVTGYFRHRQAEKARYDDTDDVGF